MPSGKKKGAKGTSSIEKAYCPILELMAFSVHPGSTESTTTVCLSKTQGRLFVTSQSNLDFSTVSSDYTDIIHALLKLKKKIASKEMTLDAACEEFWKRHCKISDAEDKASSQKAKEKFTKIKNNLYKNLFAGVIKKPNSEFNLVQKDITLIRSVKNADIFKGTTPETTGFHGESRIIRYLYIGFVQSKITTVAFKDTWQDKKDEINRLFEEWMETQGLFMGSSQGTCKGCCTCLDHFKIKHGVVGNTPKQWLHPISMNGYQGTTQITKSAAHHAFAQANHLTNLQIEHEFSDDEDVW